MKIRVDGCGLVRVSDSHKKQIARLKKGWGAEAITYKLSHDGKDVDVKCFYAQYATVLKMKILM